MKKKMKKNWKKKLCNAFARGGGGVYVPMGIFPNINMHKNIYCHLKIYFHHIQYYIIHNNTFFLVATYF